MKLISHRTKGSVLDELNMSEQERLELKLKADLHQDILKLIKKKKFTPRQLERLFDVPQPRVSELLEVSFPCSVFPNCYITATSLALMPMFD